MHALEDMRGSASLLAATCLLSACGVELPGVYEFETFTDRSTGSAVPAAPPPPLVTPARVDVSVRELVSPVAPTLVDGPSGTTGLAPYRTDGAPGYTLFDWLAIRLVGGMAYGTPRASVAPNVPFSERPVMVGGIGWVLGYWGDPTWSITFELDTELALLTGRDRYDIQVGRCTEYPGLLGGSTITCGGTSTGRTADYEGYFGAPTLGTTLDVAVTPVPVLRFGFGGSMQGMISRGVPGSAHWTAVFVGRAFVEIHHEDFYVGLEGQEAYSGTIDFWPTLALTVGGIVPEVSVDHRESSPPSDPASWHAIVSERLPCAPPTDTSPSRCDPCPGCTGSPARARSSPPRTP